MLQAHPGAVRESSYDLLGQHVRTRVVGRRFADVLAPPLEHLRSPRPSADTPRLTIELWDRSEAPLPASSACLKKDLGEIWNHQEQPVAGSSDGRFVRLSTPAGVTWLDRVANRIVGWRSSARCLPMHERARPLALLLSIWLSDREVYVVHAGLVARAGRGVLLVGPSGAGKSTTTLACVAAGFDYLSDDHCGLEKLGEQSYAGLSLFGSALLAPDHLARLPWLRPHAIPAEREDDDKSLLLLSQVSPNQLQRVASIRVLAAPRIVDRPTSTIRPATRAQALLALAPSSLFMPLRPGVGGFERLAELVTDVPAYWLELGRDLESIPAAVDELLAKVT